MTAAACTRPPPPARPEPAEPAVSPPADEVRPEVSRPADEVRPEVSTDRVAPADEVRPEEPIPAEEPVLRVGTWNLRRLGHGDKDLARVARVFADLDVVALQEVMTPEAARALLDHLPAGWRLVVTPEPVGRTRYREHYALLYREDAVRVTRWFTLDDPDDAFERDPLVVCLAAGELDFCLVSIHVIYGRRVGPRDHEIRTLAAHVEELRAAGGEKDWLLVGDFNRPGSAPSWRELTGRGWTFCDGTGDTRTTLGKSGYASAYDHIVLDPRHTAEWDGSHRRFDILVELCAGDPADCRSHISDHAPVGIDLRTAGPDDD